jgi:hypothetical protein
MTPLGLTVLRRTATLVHAVPGLRARLRHPALLRQGDDLLLEVVRPVHPGEAPTGRWLTPCSFRVAIGRAVTAVHEGRTLAVLGLEAGVDPAVELGAVRGTLLAGGIAQVPAGGSLELAFATTVDADRVLALAGAEEFDVRCHADPVARTSLVVHTTSAAPGSAEHGELLEHARTLLARCAVEELSDNLAAFVSPGSGQPAYDRPPE